MPAPYDEAISRLLEQIKHLQDEQADALKRATYVGMTPEDATICDARREAVKQLTQELANLKQAQQNGSLETASPPSKPPHLPEDA